MAFVMDPIGSIDIHGDTTFALMLEAQARGHEIACVDPGDLSLDGGRVLAKVFPVTLRREVGNHADLGEPRLACRSSTVRWCGTDPVVSSRPTRSCTRCTSRI
jgi:glutathione synthase